MCALLVILLLSTSPGNILVESAEDSEIKKEPYKVYPLILFWTSEDKLQRPTEFDVDEILWYRTYNFTPAADIKQEFLFCPPITKKKKEKPRKAEKNAEKDGISIDSVDDYCLVEIGEGLVVQFFKFIKMRKELSRCDSEPKPFISRISSAEFSIQKNEDRSFSIINCGPDNTGYLYKYGYEIFINKEVFDKVKNNLDPGLTISKEDSRGGVINYEIFRFCFDRKKNEVIYAQHRIISPKLLSHPHLRRERVKHYDMSSENFRLEEFNYFTQREELYSKYLKNKVIKKTSAKGNDEPMESSPPKPLKYETEQLVPAGDFAFALWRKPTHHYVNVELMNSKLSKLWMDILELIQKQAEMGMLEFNIYTRTYNIPKKSTDENIELEDFDIVLEEEHETLLKPPHIWIKIIHLFNKWVNRAVVIIVNNYKNEELNSHIINLFCNTDYCKHFKKNEYPEEYQYVRCCLLNNKIQKLFNLNPELIIEEEVNSLITIPELIDPSNTSSDAKKTTKAEIKTGDDI